MSKFKPSSWSPAPARSAPATVTVETPARNAVAESPASAQPSEEPVQSSALDRLALNLSLGFLFFRISYLHEFVAAKVHFDPHLLMLLGGASCLAVFLAGKWLDGVRDKTSLFWFGYAACLCLATLFSSWPGGSMPIFLGYTRTVLPVLMVLPAIIQSRDDLLRVIGTMGWAGIAMIALGFTHKEYKDGRMTITGAPSIGDSNDYSAQIMFILPIIVYAMFAARKSVVRKLIGCVVIPAGLYQILSTGSRGALVSGCLTMLLILFISRPRVKMAILLGVPSIALIAIPFVPSQSIDRLASIFKSSEGKKETEASASADARRHLLEQSLRLTFEHPLFGVGPGQFSESESTLAKQAGQKGMWHETHNTYTQVSSEVGIPALLCFVTAFFMTLRRLWKAHSANDPQLAGIAQIIFISTFGFSVCVFFLSHAYGFAFLISTSFAIVIERLLKRAPAGASITDPNLIAQPPQPTRTLRPRRQPVRA